MPPTMTPRTQMSSGSRIVSRPGDRHVDFVLVELGDLRQHRVERARALAGADHLRHHRRKHAGGPQRRGDRLAALDPAAHLLDRPLDDGVAGRLGGDVQAVENRHARAEQRGQRAAEPRHRDLAEDLADERHPAAASRRPASGRPASGSTAGTGTAAERRPTIRNGSATISLLADPDDDARRERQRGAQALEQRRERRHDLRP